MTINGPIDYLEIKGHNNKFSLNGLVRKLVVSGHNNRVISETEATRVDSLVISGHNNAVHRLKVRKLNVTGHNNSVHISECEQNRNAGFNNTVSVNGSLAAPPEMSRSHGTSYQSNISITHSHGGRTHTQVISSGQFSMPGFNINIGGLSGSIQRLVDGVLSGYGGASGSLPEEEDEELSEIEIEDEQEMEEAEQVLTVEEVKAIISSFPLHKFIPGKHKSETCSICLEKFKKDDIVKIMPCVHTFHRRCIDAWLLSNLSCPLCRCSITVSYTHLRAHETSLHLVCRLLLEKKKKHKQLQIYIEPA
eukprot:TRINITY_DN60354_c0_g1_i1.p1 TRINITY_DN60354_c0_g1~~TRINITY_DN60354_c0_g1_i1.p1  ORF type:complete len:329 (+),score=35.49 TRINITY_DN60354_c0_g1_i1:71-988(+)